MSVRVLSIRIERNLAFLCVVGAVGVVMRHRVALSGEFGHGWTIWRPSGGPTTVAVALSLAMGCRVAHTLEGKLELAKLFMQSLVLHFKLSIAVRQHYSWREF